MWSLPTYGTSSAKHRKFYSTGKRIGSVPSSGDYAQVHSMHKELLAIIYVYVLWAICHHRHLSQKLGLFTMEIRYVGDPLEWGHAHQIALPCGTKKPFWKEPTLLGRPSTCRAASRTVVHWSQWREDSITETQIILSPVQVPWKWGPRWRDIGKNNFPFSSFPQLCHQSFTHVLLLQSQHAEERITKEGHVD